MLVKLAFIEKDLARARQILRPWTSLKGLSSDETEIIARMIAQGIAEGRRHGFEMAEAEWQTHGKKPSRELNSDLSAKS
jgi:hypothetical protein